MGSNVLDASRKNNDINFTSIILNNFPYYIALGMTEEQYFDGDMALTKYYREAFEIKRKMKNQELWLQGLYFYEALLDVSPLLNAFAKKGTKAHKYPNEPYVLTEKEQKERDIERERLQSEKIKEKMFNFMNNHKKV